MFIADANLGEKYQRFSFNENFVNKISIYTDGACRGNPGPGGWGALLIYNDHKKKLSGAQENTTNNRMELTAPIKALATLKQDCDVTITTDSQYVKNGITKWIHNWKKNGWKTVSKKVVKNIDLWQALDEQIAKHRVHWKWVRGHIGHPENELADELARKAIDKLG